MNKGISIVDLATEVDRQYQTKKDYIADTRTLYMEPDGLHMNIQNINSFMLKQIAQDQLCTQLAIPKPYWQRMANEQPDLLATNVNRWLQAEPKQRMIRTLDGAIRAVLSDRYRPLDNYDLCQAVLPIISEMNLKMVSCNITDAKLYLKAIFPDIKAEIKRGDIVESGVIISNSEVGFSTLVVGPYIRRCICDNGMCVDDGTMKRRHVGKSWGDGGSDPYEIFANDTRQADDRALWLKVRDIVTATVSQPTMARIARKFVQSTEIQIEGDPVQAIELTAKKVGLSQDEQGGVLRHLIAGGDLSAWGLANAVTRLSADVEDYDRASELEAVGGKIIELGKAAWAA